MAIKTTPVRGCNDILPKQMEFRQEVINKILGVYKKNGFLQVKTPILENLEILTKGDSGDNTKLMFKTIKRGEKLNLEKENLVEADLVEEGLKYDQTVPLSRLFAGNKDKLPLPFKATQIDESFRAERPQKGRDRQFTQCDIDLWGDPTSLAEIEVITTIAEAYKTVGLKDLIFKISDRRILSSIITWAGFQKEVINNICIVVDKIDKIGIDGVKNELIAQEYCLKNVEKLINAIIDIKNGGLEVLTKYSVSENIVEDLKDIIVKVNALTDEDVEIMFDISIVRGQGYYTGAVFECYVKNNNYKGAIGGGGRYDNMLEKYTSEKIPAVGYGLGLVPTIMLLEEMGLNTFITPKLALLYDKDDNTLDLLKQKNELKQNYDVSVFPTPKNYKAFFEKLKFVGFTKFKKFKQDEIKDI